jgi:hypothetical protein
MSRPATKWSKWLTRAFIVRTLKRIDMIANYMSAEDLAKILVDHGEKSPDGIWAMWCTTCSST